MRHIGDRRVLSDRQFLYIPNALDKIQFAIDLAQRALDFRMACVADEEQDPPLRDITPSLVMHLCDERTGRVDNRERPRSRVVFNLAGYAMRAENRHRARGYLAQFLDKARSFGFQQLDDMAVMHDLVTHIDRAPYFRERAPRYQSRVPPRRKSRAVGQE